MFCTKPRQNLVTLSCLNWKHTHIVHYTTAKLLLHYYKTFTFKQRDKTFTFKQRDKTFTFKQREEKQRTEIWKDKKRKKKKARQWREGKEKELTEIRKRRRTQRSSPQWRQREQKRESHLCKKDCFCNTATVYVWLCGREKLLDFSIFLLCICKP